MSKMVFVPAGGLANRMRAVASAYTLARKTGVELSVVWFRDWALNAPFAHLFMPIRLEGMTMHDASPLDHLTLDRPRRKNLFVPRLYQRLAFDSALYEASITPLCHQHFDFDAWASHGHVYMASYTAFQTYDHALLHRLFAPQHDIERQIAAYTDLFSPHTIGVHIRRTDNVASIQQSPTELFTAAIDKEISINADTVVFLATDSEEVKRDIRSRYGKRVLTATEKADRDSTAGIRGGIVDMYTLAHTGRIYGSFQSTFSELASQIGGNELRILRRQD